METTEAEMITVWPYQILKTFWEQTVLPFVYYALVSLLPVDYTHKDPGWLPARLRKPMRPAFAVANGQCIRSEEHTSELQSRGHLVCRLLLEKKNDQYRL